MSDALSTWVANGPVPPGMRESVRWNGLVKMAGMADCSLDGERARVALDWMWGVVLPQLQKAADGGGYGYPWRTMCVSRTSADADVARLAVHAARVAAVRCAVVNDATSADWDHVRRQDVADQGAFAAAAAAARADYWRTQPDVPGANSCIAFWAIVCALNCSSAISEAGQFWADVDPCGCLERMVAVRQIAV